MYLKKDQEKTARKITKMLKGEFINDPKSSPAMKMISRLFFDEVRDPGEGYTLILVEEHVMKFVLKGNLQEIPRFNC